MSAAGDDRRGAREQPQQRAHAGDAAADVTGEEADEQPGHRRERHLERECREPPGAGERGDGAHPVPGAQGLVAEVGPALDELLAVSSSGRRHHDDAGTPAMRPPAQVDVFAVEADRRVEATERAEQIGAHEETGRRQREHVAHRVVLLLVDLTGLHERVDLTEAVDGETDVLQHPRPVPIDELRADDAGVRAVELLDQQPDRVGIEGHVVVEEAEEPVVTLDEAQHLVGHGTEPGVALGTTYERVRHGRTDALGQVAHVADHEEQRPQVGVVLAGETGQDLVEPGPRLVDDHDRDDRRRTGGFHEDARLAVRTRHARSTVRAPPIDRACNS